MKKFKNRNGGFIGILFMLVALAAIMIYIVRPDIITGKKETKGMLEQNLDVVQKAKDIKSVVEKNSAKQADEIDKLNLN